LVKFFKKENGTKIAHISMHVCRKKKSRTKTSEEKCLKGFVRPYQKKENMMY